MMEPKQASGESRDETTPLFADCSTDLLDAARRERIAVEAMFAGDAERLLEDFEHRAMGVDRGDQPGDVLS